MSEWVYNGESISSERYQELVNEGYIGFVYQITCPDGKKYIGKKLWQTKRKLPPLKGKTRKRIKIVETDWRSYYGSNDVIKQLVEEKGENEFKREILYLCRSKGELGYLEAKVQFDYEVLLKPEEYHNGIIQCKIHRTHVVNSVGKEK